MDKSRHPKSKHLLASGLFAGLRSFAEFERRVSALPTGKECGDAFEVFAEAYLATQRKHDTAQIWPLCAAPLELLQKLGLATNDYGVDGVLQTALGQLNVYQVKFRTHRQPLTWRELSTFMGLADSAHIHSRVLFTNCDELPSVMNERRGFFCIRGSDLDRLEESDFIEIEKWLAGVAAPIAKKSPQPHQQEALEAWLRALREHDRATAIMACGTGKTLLSLWIAEHVAQASSPAGSGGVPAASPNSGQGCPENPQARTPAPRILVLLPSLALVRQTLHEWLHETRLSSLAYLCVCSDRTVTSDLDAIATPQSELDFEVTTDSRSVREFLDAPFAGAKVIFSTYQSVGKAIKPALRKGETFDLGIFDEAHKTAGREGRNFAFALDDKNLGIRKRLFLTATPRHYNPLRKDKEGDAQLVFSMDKPDVYGPQAYRLTFAEAARRGIICHYRVIISVITSGMVTNELLNRGEVLVNGDAIRACQVANQLALKDAIAKYGVNKVFTFHSSVKSAASFTSDGPEGIAMHLSSVAANVRRLHSNSEIRIANSEIDQNLVTSSATNGFKTFHVNGTMPTALRERVMRGFRECARGIMSNARCLTEGVDVPAVDMVAFLSPRRSRVDSVQATGRAMRRAPHKTTGYVLVPLYVEQAASETIEEAVSRAEFDDVWDVLQSLQEQDEVLAEIIREMREERGRTNGFNDARLRDMADVLGPKVALEAIRAAINAQCIESLGVRWYERLGQLQAFYAERGHSNVTSRDDVVLANWAANQRRLKKTGRLSPERFQRLEALGFSWEVRDDKWEEMFTALREFQRAHGHCAVHLYTSEPRRLHQQLVIWISKQRRFFKRGKMSHERLVRLNAIGFSWDSNADVWEAMFKALQAYKEANGDCDVPRAFRKTQLIANYEASLREEADAGSHAMPLRLAWWVHCQRELRRKGKLSHDHFRRLQEVGFAWDQEDHEWRKMYSALSRLLSLAGIAELELALQQDVELNKWVRAQQSAKKRGGLNPQQRTALDEIGFPWEFQTKSESQNKHSQSSKPAWEDSFAKLSEFQKLHGHCDMKLVLPLNERLHKWTQAQRQARQRGEITSEQVSQLDQIGFLWDTNSLLWERMLKALIAHKSVHGDCNVPRYWQQNLQLAVWVASQRKRHSLGELKLNQTERLNQIGFEWEGK